MVTLTISDFDLAHTNTDNKAFSIDTPTPIYVLPKSTEEVEFAYVPSGGSPPEEAIVTIDSNDPDLNSNIYLQGNDCENSVDENWDVALFRDQGSSPASMEAGKAADAIGAQIGFTCTQADAEQAHVQSTLKGVKTKAR